MSTHYVVAVGRLASCSCGWTFDSVTRRGAREAAARHEAFVMSHKPEETES